MTCVPESTVHIVIIAVRYIDVSADRIHANLKRNFSRTECGNNLRAR